MSLAQIPLHWMVEQVIQSSCGILFDNDQLAHIGFKLPSPSPQPSVTGGQILLDSNINDPPIRDAADTSRPVAPELENKDQPAPTPTYSEHANAIAPLFDELKINKVWWLLEVLPSSNAWQDSSGVWHNKWRWVLEYCFAELAGSAKFWVQH